MKSTKRWLALLLAAGLAVTALTMTGCQEGHNHTHEPVDMETGTGIAGNPDAYITLGQYKGLKVAKQDTSVTIEAARAEYQNIMKDASSYPPEIIEAFSEYETVDEYVEYLRGLLIAQKEETAKQAYLTSALEQIVANSTFTDLIQDEIDAYVKDIESYYKEQAGDQSLKDFINEKFPVTYEEFRADNKKEAELNVKNQAVVYAVAEAEDLVLTQELYDHYVELYADRYGMTYREIEDTMTRTTLKQYAFRDMVFDFILDNTIVE